MSGQEKCVTWYGVEYQTLDAHPICSEKKEKEEIMSGQEKCQRRPVQ
jgi:hypothetical protein